MWAGATTVKTKCIAFLLIFCTLFASAFPVSAASPTHGTSKQWIREEQLVTTVPSDYKINSATQGKAKDGAYDAYFLKDDLQTVSITIDENNLNYLLQNALKEEYVMTESVTIGDTTLGYCGLRAKGNYTLQHAYTDNPGSDRFSFTVDFDRYVSKELFSEGQNFYGCDRISFNNFFFDKSMLKEYCALMLFSQMGLPTPQFGLAKLYINGEYYGVYFMLEAMDESILEQYYGVQGSELSGYLCKPTGTRLRYSELVQDPSPLYDYDSETYEKVKEMLPTVLEWSRKLELLSKGLDFNGNAVDVQSEQYLELLSQVMDIEETVKYFAVHSWLCQTDDMFVNLQNYGLYIDRDGISTLLPWDYDLAFGCYTPGTAETTANYPVDVMYILDSSLWDEESTYSAQFYKNFPLFYVIYQNEALMEKFHSYLLDCSRIAALGGTTQGGTVYDPGWFASLIDALEEPLIAAASEELADHVYYMNGIRQPQDVKLALPHLTRIIALRAVGVYNQVTGKDGWVCASGCNLETLGNAHNADTTLDGRLTLIDSTTGVFLTADFSDGRQSRRPMLVVTRQSPDSKTYQTALSLAQPQAGEEMLVLDMKSSVSAESAYLLTVPLPAEYLQDGASYRFYWLQNGTLVPLEMSRRDNLCSCLTENLGTLVVLAKLPAQSLDADSLLGIGILAGTSVILLGIATWEILRKRRKKC